MKNNWIFISSLRTRQSLLADFLSNCKKNNLNFHLICSSKALKRRGRREYWSFSKLKILPLSFLVFIIFWPLIWVCSKLIFFFKFISKKPSSIVLINWPEKILLSSLARRFSKNVIWLEYPDFSVKDLPWLIKKLYFKKARNVKTLSFSKEKIEYLKNNGVNDAEYIFFPLSRTIIEQDSIFKNLANQEKRGRFVIGSVLYGLPKDQAEILLSALAIANSVCPIIELVIIGEGKNRKQIQWLAKRMNLERKVWLAGPASDFGKWLNHLDLYVIASKKPGLEEAAWAMSAMQIGLPVIGPMQSWLADFITPKNGALVDIEDAETLARQFINLQQNEELCKEFGKEATKIANNFSFERFFEAMVNLLS